jgi:putative inorganic carbon (hco3(-)) transporter
LFWPFYDLLKDETGFKWGTRLFEYLMYSLVGLGLLQLIFFPSLMSLMVYGWDPHTNRMVSTFLDPNFLSAFLNIGFAYFLAKFYSSKKPIWETIWPVLILALAIGLTFSRSGWLMMAVITLVFALFRDRRLFIVAAVILLLVIQFVPRFSQRIIEGINWQESAAMRLTNWEQGYKIISNNFTFGVGYNNLEEVKLQENIITPQELKSHSAAGIDSSLMVVWSTTGIIGLIIFLYWSLMNIYLGFKAHFSKIFHRKLAGNFGLGVAGVFIGLLVHSLFVNSFLNPPIIVALMFYLAIFYNLYKPISEKEE